MRTSNITQIIVVHLFGDISNECMIKSINQESSQISREFTKNIGLRFTPKLYFKIDTLTKDSQRLEFIFDHLKK